jgi:hypothetical protein
VQPPGDHDGPLATAGEAASAGLGAGNGDYVKFPYWTGMGGYG